MSVPRDRSNRWSPASRSEPSDSPAPNLAVNPASQPRRGSRVWLWIIAAFALQLAAWTAWFIIASHNRVEEVPLAGAIGNKR